jgi:hypothetical protein
VLDALGALALTVKTRRLPGFEATEEKVRRMRDVLHQDIFKMTSAGGIPFEIGSSVESAATAREIA